MAASSRSLLVGLATGLATGSLVAAAGALTWSLTGGRIQAAGAVRLAPPDTLAVGGSIAGAALLACVLGALLRRGRPRRNACIAAGLILCASAALLVGQWSLSLSPGALREDSLFDFRGERDITAAIQSVAVQSLEPAGAPDRARVTLEDGRDLVISGSNQVAQLSQALRSADVRPTLGVAVDSAASARIERHLADSARDYRDLEPYLVLFRTGKASAGHLHATALQLEAGRQRHDSLRGPMLRLVADALRGLPSFLPTPDEEAALRIRLEDRVGAEAELIQAAYEAGAPDGLAGLTQLTVHLGDTSYRLRLLASQNLLALVSLDSYPPGVGSTIPAASEKGAWQRLATAWQSWLNEHRTGLAFVAGRWRRPGPLVDILAWAGCAERDLDCLGHILGFLEHADPTARRSASSRMRQLVCPELHPRIPEPAFALDEEWQPYASAWREWFTEYRDRLARVRCAESGQDAWGLGE